MAHSHPESTEHGPPRLPAEERRRQLIEVAIDVFSRRGFSGTTTKEIAAAAGVTEAIIFRHFATKEQLYTAIIEYRFAGEAAEEWFAETRADMERNDDEAVFHRLTTALIEGARKDKKYERLMLYAVLEGHELATLKHQLTEPFVRVLREYIERRQHEGAIRRFNPSVVISAIAGMAQQYAMHVHLCGFQEMDFDDEEAARTFTNILLDGIKTRSADGSSK